MSAVEVERAAHAATVALAEFDRAGVTTVLQTVPALALTLRELLAAVTAPTPPADDVREAVAKAVCAADEPTLDYERKWPSETDEIFYDEGWRYYLGIADRLIATGIPAAAALATAAEVRPRGTVTDAEVLRAKAAALTEFADAVRMPFTVFRGDNGEPITPGDLMRETAARYLTEAETAARS